MSDEQRDLAKARVQHTFDMRFVPASIDHPGATAEMRSAKALEYIAAQLGEIRDLLAEQARKK
ncbi:hypothetical protein [Aureimonas leprariae]|uniref:Uncharacterized protein n=1 Tax=Plantimonas leprariae TaxID=2615207 RepID=A0A7V7PSB3_9HYPH|nr:hypothetical protein [Aureimonas leprariae]KAB0682024.1 hypothetical protein F6X38_04255 [Aureimonas leprariae]